MEKHVLENNNISVKYNGFVHDAYRFVEDAQLLNEELWARFVEQFRSDSDFDNGWRGEYWGKMMRGASLVYSYTKNETLYSILRKTVSDMIACADSTGRISSYGTNHEFNGWDMWCRKYVILGMEYFLDICKEEQLRTEVISSMCRQVDYIISKIGKGEGKTEITSASQHWRGLNSSSILESVVRLYNLTSLKKYFDFAEYIVECGGTDVENIFDLAYKNELYPYQYPVTKAYEMISCFEGLLEFYKITGSEKYKEAIVNFADKILESDFTVIGCCGCTHELFDHSSVRQANTTNNDVMQETCVTVTLMKFLYRVFLLTGNPKYIDAFEISFYNAYLGSLNTAKTIEGFIFRDHPELIKEPLPFYSYSPLTAGKRSTIIGGFKIMSDKHYYGCCACIGSAGIGLVHKAHYSLFENALAVNMFIDGKSTLTLPSGNEITITSETKYPCSGNVKMIIEIKQSEKFSLYIRNPEWSKKTRVLVNGESVLSEEGYIKINRVWNNLDEIELDFDMTTYAIRPTPYGEQVLMNKVIFEKNYVVPNYDREDPQAKNHIALRRGPLVLAQDSDFGYNVDNPISIKISDNGTVDAICNTDENFGKYVVKVDVPLLSGETLTLADYGSVGKSPDVNNKIAAWILTNNI